MENSYEREMGGDLYRLMKHEEKKAAKLDFSPEEEFFKHKDNCSTCEPDPPPPCCHDDFEHSHHCKPSHHSPLPRPTPCDCDIDKPCRKKSFFPGLSGIFDKINIEDLILIGLLILLWNENADWEILIVIGILFFLS